MLSELLVVAYMLSEHSGVTYRLSELSWLQICYQNLIE